MSSVPRIRIRKLNEYSENSDGEYVLYWMTACRRTRFNFALQYAADRAEQLNVPLVVLEALRLDYPWASARFHRFIMDGMIENSKAFAASAVHYFPYVEETLGAGKGFVASYG